MSTFSKKKKLNSLHTLCTSYRTGISNVEITPLRKMRLYLHELQVLHCCLHGVSLPEGFQPGGGKAPCRRRDTPCQMDQPQPKRQSPTLPRVLRQHYIISRLPRNKSRCPNTEAAQGKPSGVLQPGWGWPFWPCWTRGKPWLK